MALTYDIRKCEPERTDRYFVDTNVWYWFSADASFLEDAKMYQVREYPRYIEAVLDKGARLYHSPLTFVELAHLIEKKECMKVHGPAWHQKVKEFRQDKGRRELVLSHIEQCWRQVSSISDCMPVKFEGDFPERMGGILSTALLDAYDACYCVEMENHGIENIISDDYDFSYASGFHVFTCNDAFF